MLSDRGRAAAHHEDPGVPRRPARHGDHLRRRAAERARTRRQAHRRGARGVQRRGRERHRLRQALHAAGRAPREHPDVRHQGRDLQRARRGHESVQADVFAVETQARTLADALRDADVFFGLSSAAASRRKCCGPWPRIPIVFALANPDPEIAYDVARATRPDAIVATGRSDYPNQVNNVLGISVHLSRRAGCARHHHQRRDETGGHAALAALAKEDVPDSVRRAYGIERLEFGRDYLIPKPFDPRVLVWEASAVAEAAITDGRGPASRSISDEYREQLERRLGKAREVMRVMIHKAQRAPKRIVFPGRRGRQDSARRSDPGGREDRDAHSAGQRGGDSQAHGRACICMSDTSSHPRSGERARPRKLHRGAVPAAPAERDHAARSRRHAARPHGFRRPHGAPRRGGRADRRLNAALSRHHPAGAAGDFGAPRPAQGFRCLRADHAAGRHLLPGRRHGQHRADLRRPGGDRHLRRRDGTTFRTGAAGGAAVVLQFRQHAPSAGGEGSARRGAGAPTRSRA